MCEAVYRVRLNREELFILDGSKIRANASINQTKSKEWLIKENKKLEERIDKLLKESEEADESETGTLISMSTELKDKRKLKEKIEGLLKKIEDEKKEKNK